MKSLSYTFLILLLVNFIKLPSLVFANAEPLLFPGQKLKYFRLADKKIYGFNNFDVKILNKNWVIEGQRLYKYYQSEKIIDTYTENIRIRLSEDYQLLYLESEVKKNGRKYEKWVIQYKKIYYDHRHELLDLKQFIHKKVPAQRPLYFYDINYPWTVEILLKNNVVNSKTPCQIISFKGEETIEIEPEKAQESSDEKVFLVNKKVRILVDSDFNVSEIQTGNRKIIKKTQKEFSDLNIEGWKIDSEIHSNIRFIRPELLTYLHVKIKDEINFPSGAKTVATLGSPRQTFQGNAKNDGIDGDVFITAKPNPSGDLVPFPVKETWKLTFTEYLKPEDLIESNHPRIIAKAREITAGSKTVGEAVRNITGWVHKNIQGKEAASESALETLINKKGVCHQFSRLSVALCRAVNIPARCITGIINLGQNFVYHEWVEIYFGEKDGWVAMDPAMGQIDFVDASHIGLSNTATNWQSSDDEKTLQVIDYQPSSVTPVFNEHAVDLKRIWQKYHSLDYSFFKNGKETGSYGAKFDINSAQQLLLIENFGVPDKSINIVSQLILTEQGYAIHYKSAGKWHGNVYGNEVDYGEQISQQLLVGEQSYQKSIARVSQSESQAEGYSFFEWGLVLARLIDGVTEKMDKRLTIFMPDIQRYMNIDVTVWPVEIDFLGAKTAGMACNILSFPYSRHILITKKGIITRLEIPEIKVTVDLIKVNRH
jgi:hypothetical protein